MKNKLKYIIIDPEEGIFLGTSKNENLSFMDRRPGDKRLLALFSNNNILGITKAIGFAKEKDALFYMNVYIRERYPRAFVASVIDNTVGPYVDTVSIVKSGHGHYAWDMIDELPTPSQVLH
jgi:hypothetical protein|tara:strand:- start:338 stop:700 length:363 start_codon:yes stop_codon:yes gene_type:complete